MKRHFVLSVLFALFAACASQTGSAPSAPVVTIAQLTSEPGVAEHVTGGLPVRYQLTVTNTAAVPIRLKRAEVVSVGEGAYSVNPTSNPFNVTIAPGESASVDFWVAAYAATAIAGANGAVTLRVTTEYDGPNGTFQNIVVKNVMGRV